MYIVSFCYLAWLCRCQKVVTRYKQAAKLPSIIKRAHMRCQAYSPWMGIKIWINIWLIQTTSALESIILQFPDTETPKNWVILIWWNFLSVSLNLSVSVTWALGPCVVMGWSLFVLLSNSVSPQSSEDSRQAHISHPPSVPHKENIVNISK